MIIAILIMFPVLFMAASKTQPSNFDLITGGFVSMGGVMCMYHYKKCYDSLEKKGFSFHKTDRETAIFFFF